MRRPVASRPVPPALTDVALTVRGVRQVLIYTDEANVRSAAIPKRLGFELLRVEAADRIASSETGRQQVWRRTTPIGADDDPPAPSA